MLGLALPFAVNWRKLVIGSLPVLAVLGTGWAVYSLGSSHGEAAVQARWDKALLKDREELDKLRAQAATREAQHRKAVAEITHELAESDKKHQVDLARIDADYAIRLRNSEERAAKFHSMSQSGAIECGNLAGHAAKLDHSLEEGRRLVKEFRSTLELRDQQLRSLGQQILTDRALIGDKDGTNGTKGTSPH